MSAGLSVRSASASHVGHVRKLNEDSYLSRPEIGLWVVADGMGGHGGGDYASQAVVKALSDMPAPNSAAAFLADFEGRIGQVNAHLLSHARSNNRPVVGTTLAAILIYDSHFAGVWCGDSRIYRWRSGALTQLSKDHSEVQDLIDRGVLDRKEAKTWPRRNVVTRALGAQEPAELEIVDAPAMAGDRFLLCSDGLTGHVEDDEIAAILAKDDPHQMCDELVALTLQRGASDNVSVVALICEEDARTVRSDGAWMREIARSRENGA